MFFYPFSPFVSSPIIGAFAEAIADVIGAIVVAKTIKKI